MNEKEFTEIAKRYLKKQGYEIASRMIYDETGATLFGVDLSNRDYAIRRTKQMPPTPDTVHLFAKHTSCAGAYPDIIAIKNGKPYMFEVKTTLNDRWIGQCLRYLTAYPFFGEITLITPKGFADGWLKVVSKFKLPIKCLQIEE